ncbi:MAG: hypothetical protein JSR17_01060 [Proteobacteria bacterium]|nr:hypothetical protein [Pseudomonadota bacterium]
MSQGKALLIHILHTLILKNSNGFGESKDACSGGIHAFADIETAWDYFGSHKDFYE